MEPSEQAPTKPISLGLTNFQQAKPEKETNLPLSPSLEAWLTCQATILEGKDRHGKVIKPTLGQKSYPKLPSLRAERFVSSDASSFLRVGQLPPEWHRLVSGQGRISPETVSFTGWSLASSNLRFRRFSPSSRIWIGGLPGCLTSQRIYNPFYLMTRIPSLLGSARRDICPFREELEIQVTALFSHFKLRERDGYLSRLSPHVPLATKRDLRISPLVGEYLLDEVLVSQAGDRLQGDVSLKIQHFYVGYLAKKSQDHKVRTLPPPKRPAPALTTLVSFRKPKQNPQPTGRGRVKIQGQRPFLRAICP